MSAVTASRTAQSVSGSIVVAAPPAAVFAVLTDTARHPEIDGSGTVRATRGEGKVLTGVGDTFGMAMRRGVPYLIRNTVVEFERDRLIAWRHLGRHRWRYELEPVAGGTHVTETFDWAPALLPWMYGPLGMVEDNARSIAETLPRLRDVVERDA